MAAGAVRRQVGLIDECIPMKLNANIFVDVPTDCIGFGELDIIT